MSIQYALLLFFKEKRRNRMEDKRMEDEKERWKRMEGSSNINIHDTLKHEIYETFNVHDI